MDNKFLYENIIMELGLKTILQKEIDSSIIDNLNDKYELRYYQEEAFKFAQTYFEDNHSFNNYPISLLFHMATGSGKTLIMAGLILYLYTKGYNNFIFFVNSSDIIEKTIDNFLNKFSNKYLFQDKIFLNDKYVKICSVKNFEDCNDENINICFTTIHKLHNDLTIERENAITLDDFKDKKIVLISDESHHMQTKTKKSLSSEHNWENTIELIHNINKDNVLLEFTATPGYESNLDVYKKYLSRLIYKYDLKKFVKDKFSKNIDILRVDIDDIEYLMLISIIINQYRQDIANKNDINLKPVLLFKASKEIKDSSYNQELFNSLIENLSVSQIDNFKKNNHHPILKRIFHFYEEENISLSMLVDKLKINFSKENCLNVNEKNMNLKSLSKKDFNELISQQNILNTLEDPDNNIRVIFAVRKLDEGWDVLNLFDIVRIPFRKNKKTNKKIKESTISEAQLIGRGSRYYPFVTSNNFDKYKRKFDNDIDNELKILEDLYYYSFDDSEYILELKNALREEGFSLSEDMEHKSIKLKDNFKNTNFYKNGKIFINKKIHKKSSYIKSFKELNENIRNYHYDLKFGKIKISEGFNNEKETETIKYSKMINLEDIEKHVIKNALSKIRFYDFNHFNKFFSINCIDDIIYNSNYLKDFTITFHAIENDLTYISNSQKFEAVYNLLIDIEKEIKKQITSYKGSMEFEEKFIKEIFYDKDINISKNEIERLNGDEEIIKNQDWYVFNANYGTSEEKSFFNFIKSIIHNFEENFDEVYLIRNERHFKIYNFKNGDAFEPDFVLFVKDNKKLIQYQLFIEPKGNHLLEHDNWKNDFLKSIDKCIDTNLSLVETEKYRIYGLPFYNSSNEIKFKEYLFEFFNFN